MLGVPRKSISQAGKQKGRKWLVFTALAAFFFQSPALLMGLRFEGNDDNGKL
jgi:hypothetical protein